MSSSGNNGAQKKDSNRVQEGYTPEGTPADKSPYSCRQANHCQDLKSWANASQPDSSASKSRAILAQGGGDYRWVNSFQKRVQSLHAFSSENLQVFKIHFMPPSLLCPPPSLTQNRVKAEQI